MMRFRNVVFGPIPFPLVPLFSFAKFFVNNHRKKPLLRRSHSNPQHVASLLRERLSTPIFCLRMMEGCNVLCSSTTHPSSPKAEKEKLPSNATRTSKWSKFKKCSNARSSATEFCRGVSVTNNRFADKTQPNTCAAQCLGCSGDVLRPLRSKLQRIGLMGHVHHCEFWSCSQDMEL